MQKSRLVIIILLFLLTGGVSANEVLNGELCNIPADTVIKQDILVLCGELVIEGHVEGHVMGAARTAIIRGKVDGSVYLVAGELLLEGGTIGKDVHFAGLVLDVEDGTMFEHESGGIVSANLSSIIEPKAVIPGSINTIGYQLIMDGDVGQDISFWGAALNINGHVGRGVTATVGNSASEGVASQIETLLIPFAFDIFLVDPGLEVSEDAKIEGTLEYRSPTIGLILGDTGETIFRPITQQITAATPVEESARKLQRYLEAVLREFFTLALIGAIILLILPREIQSPIRAIQMRPISTLGVGMLSFILSFPIVLIVGLVSLLLVASLWLLPLKSLAIFGGLALGLANIGGASVFYFTAIYVARLVVGMAIGRFIIWRFFNSNGSWRYRYLGMALGVLALAMLVSIPVVGIGFNAFSLFLGLGAILTGLRKQFNRFLNTSSAPLPATYPYFTDQLSPPPFIPDSSQPLGTENLPEGFNWWGEKKDT